MMAQQFCTTFWFDLWWFKLFEPRTGDHYTKVPKAKSLKMMIIMWNVFLNSQDTTLLAIQPAIQPATSIIQQIKSLVMIENDFWFNLAC